MSGDFIEICDDPGEVCSSCPVESAPALRSMDRIRSAAYNLLQGDTAPRPGCFPDAPNDRGCPLLAATPYSDPQEPVIPEGTLTSAAARCVPNIARMCRQACRSALPAMRLSVQAMGKDVDLVNEACTGLKDGKIGEILQLETEVGCSCCVSQICGCEPDEPTNPEIYMLNQQCDRHITPQCDINGTLCGSL